MPPQATTSDRSKLEHRSWSNWILLAGVSLICTSGLAIAISPLLGDYLGSIWPWLPTGSALLGGLLVSMVILLAYLTQKERQLVRMRHRVRQLQTDAMERAQRNYSQLLALFNVSRLIGTDTNLQAVFDCITRMCTESFDCQRASLMVVDHARSELVVRSASDLLKEQSLVGARRKIGEGIAGWVAEHRQPVLLGPGKEGIDSYLDLQFEPRSMSASMVVPVLVKDDLVAVLSVSTQAESVSYNEDDLRVLWMFAENAGTCIRQATHQADTASDDNDSRPKKDGIRPTGVSFTSTFIEE